jgi:ribosomal protein S20
MKTAMKRILTADPATLTVAQVADAMRLVDKAGKDGVIHKNAASRRKGQLDRALAAKKAAK